MLESTAVNAKHSGSGPVSRFTNFSSFAKGDRHEMQGEQTNRHWSGSREWESQPSIPCTERWRRWWYPLSLGWLHEHGMLSHSAHLLNASKASADTISLRAFLYFSLYGSFSTISKHQAQQDTACEGIASGSPREHSISWRREALQMCSKFLHAGINICTWKAKPTGTTLKTEG